MTWRDLAETAALLFWLIGGALALRSINRKGRKR